MWPDADLSVEDDAGYDDLDPANEPHDRESARHYEGGTAGATPARASK